MPTSSGCAACCRRWRRPAGSASSGAGSVPLVDGSALGITESPRYERMRDEYQMLAFEQQICGTQVHVDVPDRDAAVAVMQHSAPWLPVLLALSASSPFWQSEDTGYASSRTLAWHRWPTAGPPAPLRDAADYDALIDDLLRSGTMSDPGMVYFDMRPSAHQKTVELRICDASPTVDGVVLDRRARPCAGACTASGRTPRDARSRSTGPSCCARRAGAPPAPGSRATSST